jgi:hypothetical protein
MCRHLSITALHNIKRGLNNNTKGRGRSMYRKNAKAREAAAQT